MHLVSNQFFFFVRPSQNEPKAKNKCIVWLLQYNILSGGTKSSCVSQYTSQYTSGPTQLIPLTQHY